MLDFTSGVIIALIALVIELLVSFIYLSKTKLPNKILISVVIGNIITFPGAWFILNRIDVFPLQIFLAEVFVILIEGYVIFFFNKQVITLRRSFILSTIMNLADIAFASIIFLLGIIYLAIRVISAF